MEVVPVVFVIDAMTDVHRCEVSEDLDPARVALS